VKHETAGDPMTELKWTRKTTEKIAVELGNLDIHVSANTVGRLLKQMDFSLKVNHKKLSSGSKADQGERDEQFVYIAELKEEFASVSNPIVSVDTKKRDGRQLQESRHSLVQGTGSCQRPRFPFGG
jgi:hypothetical protein